MAEMADNMIEDEFPWLSAELRILETQYEKSKLRVFQDTLLCKRSMVELELLIKSEQLQENAIVNNKIRKHESQLQERLEALSTELQNTTKQLQTAQETLQDEKVHHDLERKKLEDKLNSKMEKKIEEQRKSASQREKLLQKEIKNLQEKHVQTFREVEDLKMELGGKNVAVKTKAIQTRVTVEDASTMAPADLQTCNIGVQVLSESIFKKGKQVRKTDNVHKITECVRSNSPSPESLLACYRTNDDNVHMMNEGVRKTDEYVSENGEDFRETDENVQEIDNLRNGSEDVKKMDEPVRRRKRVPEAEEGTNDTRIVKNVQPEGEKGRNAKRNVKERKVNKGEDTANEVTDKEEDKENPKALPKRKPTKQERGSDSNNPTSENSANKLHKRTKASSVWLLSGASQEEDIPLEYSKTPGRLQIKLDESNQSREKGKDKDVGSCSGEEIAGSVTETCASEKSSECSFEKLSQLVVCVEDIGNKQVSKDSKNGADLKTVSHKEDVQDNHDSTEKSTQGHLEELSHPVLKKDEKCFLALTERQKRIEEELIGSNSANVSEHEKNKDSNNVQNKNEKAGRVKEKRENKKRKKTKKVKTPKEKGCEDASPEEKKREHEGAQNKGGRILRKRTAKKRNWDVELDPCKGQVEDSKPLCTEARQEPHDNCTIATEKNDKIDDRSLKGHAPVMSLMSSPDANQLPRESELSSREIDPIVDENPVTSSGKSQQLETEIQGGLNEENNKAAEGEHLMDYNSAQGGSDKNDNRIKEAGKKTKQDCLHKELRKNKSGRSSNEAKNKINTENNEKETKNIDPCSTKCKDQKQTRKNSEHEDANVSKEKDTDVVNIESYESLTRQEVKSAVCPDMAQSKRKDSKHSCEKTETASKENALSNKTRGQKRRKPTSSMSEVLAPADRQSCGSNVTSTSTEMSSMLDNTKKRKTLFNSRENSLMVSNAKTQISFANTTLSKSRTSTGIPPSLSAFMRNFIAPKLKKSR